VRFRFLLIAVFLSRFLLMPFVIFKNWHKPGPIRVVYSVYIYYSSIVVTDSIHLCIEFIVCEA